MGRCSNRTRGDFGVGLVLVGVLALVGRQRVPASVDGLPVRRLDDHARSVLAAIIPDIVIAGAAFAVFALAGDLSVAVALVSALASAGLVGGLWTLLLARRFRHRTGEGLALLGGRRIGMRALCVIRPPESTRSPSVPDT
jgi:hypothetical protein